MHIAFSTKGLKVVDRRLCTVKGFIRGLTLDRRMRLTIFEVNEGGDGLSPKSLVLVW
jgi:hypothetical protein